MSEATYWVIVIAALAGALAIWLLTREPVKPKRPRKLPPAPPEQTAAVAPPEEISPVASAEEPIATSSDEPPPDVAGGLQAARKRGRPKKLVTGPPDALTMLKGLGPRAAARLNELGITRYDQIAAWTGEDIARIDPEMGSFKGRIVRDRWIEQAGYLASGDRAGFEAKFGRLS